MFFMIGTWPGRKDLGIIDGYNVFMVYESLIIFFIPVFKFGKRYYAEKNGSVFEIDQETGKAIERGEEVSLHFTGAPQYTSSNTSVWGNANLPAGGNANLRTGENADGSAADTAGSAVLPAAASPAKICMRCGFRTENEEYSHCPMCGNKLVHE